MNYESMAAPPSLARESAPYSIRERSIILAFSFLGTVFDGADFSIFLFFMVPLSHYLHRSILDVSLIQASSYVVGIAGGVAFGIVADRFGRRVGLALTIAVFGVFTFLTAFTNDYVTLFTLRILAGIGIGGEAGIAFAYVNEAFPGKDDRRGLLSGLLQAMFLVGIWLAAWMYSLTTEAFGALAWRWAFGALGTVALLSGAVRIYMPESRVWLASRMAIPKGARQPAGSRLAILDIFRGGMAARTFTATVVLTCGFYGAYAVVTHAPAMWQTVYKLPPATVGRLGMLASVLGAVSYVMGGALSDRFGRRRAFALTSGIGIIAYTSFLCSILGVFGPYDAASTLKWDSPIIMSYVFVQIGYGYFGIQGVWLSELFPTNVRTTAQNFVYYVSRAIGGGVAPLAGVFLSRRLGWGLEYAVAFGLIGALGAFVFCRWLPETKGQALPISEA